MNDYNTALEGVVESPEKSWQAVLFVTPQPRQASFANNSTLLVEVK